MRNLLPIALVFMLAGNAHAVTVYNLAGAVATTSTSAAVGAQGGPVSTSAAEASASVWGCATGSPAAGTCAGASSSTVLLEEQASYGTTPAPWVLVATLVNCDSAGNGTVTPASTGVAAAGVCGFVTLTPKTRTRLRVSAWTSGALWGVIVTTP